MNRGLEEGSHLVFSYFLYVFRCASRKGFRIGLGSGVFAK